MSQDFALKRVNCQSVSQRSSKFHTKLSFSGEKSKNIIASTCHLQVSFFSLPVPSIGSQSSIYTAAVSSRADRTTPTWRRCDNIMHRRHRAKFGKATTDFSSVSTYILFIHWDSHTLLQRALCRSTCIYTRLCPRKAHAVAREACLLAKRRDKFFNYFVNDNVILRNDVRLREIEVFRERYASKPT